ncbi:zinc-binding alcohol dehydrogenase family protein [Acidicapsa dinghuensis]|uniref:Zinc-binding alcohol dehydrogenase family protein n=1 Tax=Acidicapsa dinghuensis TaxID=2218256 RepID=A0ABW1EEP7_9BACT|nr:zinc-binding alcohol dehydrogenase family protein [Acidicapsa dinghuensis]
MKAVVIEKPGQAAVQSVADPTPKPGEVLLKIRRVGLCGTDLNSFRGKNPMVSYPRVIGHEICATVVEASSGHPHLTTGTNVTVSPYIPCGRCPACLRGRANACQINQTLGVMCDGALAEYFAIDAAKLYTASLGLEELCLVEPLSVGFHAVARGRVAADDAVAIWGCGGVGLGAIAASGFRGAKTIAIDMDDAKLALARKAGATDTINAATEPVHDKLLEITNGRGPDVAIEAIGLPATFRAAVEEVAFTGRVVYIGYAKEQVAYETRLFVQKELDILGSRNAQSADFREVIAMLEAGRFPVDSAISHTISLNETPETLQAWSTNPVAYSKIIVRVS